MTVSHAGVQGRIWGLHLGLPVTGTVSTDTYVDGRNYIIVAETRHYYLGPRPKTTAASSIWQSIFMPEHFTLLGLQLSFLLFEIPTCNREQQQMYIT